MKDVLIKTLKDKFHNTAKIEKVYIYPYCGAREKSAGYRLICSSDYDGNFVYFVSVYSSVADCMNELSKISCGTFEEV